jgi:DNA-binding NarL/FixJ family response regulator
MSEDRSRGMYHSLIGKPSLRVVLVMGLLIGLCLLLLAACGGEESAKGGAGGEHNKSTTRPQAFPTLTDREREILNLIAQAHPNPSIARQLSLSTKTVSNYVSNIFTKLQVADRAQAIIRAREAGLG